MRSRLTVVLLALAVASAAGAVWLLRPRPAPGVTADNFRRVHRGMTEAGVRAVLGDPDEGQRARVTLRYFQTWRGEGCYAVVSFSELEGVGVDGGHFQSAQGWSMEVQPPTLWGRLRRMWRCRPWHAD